MLSLPAGAARLQQGVYSWLVQKTEPKEHTAKQHQVGTVSAPLPMTEGAVTGTDEGCGQGLKQSVARRRRGVANGSH